MKRTNTGSGTSFPSAKRLKENQTIEDYLTEQGAGERAIFERLRVVSQQRKDHELWTYFRRDDKTSLEGFQQIAMPALKIFQHIRQQAGGDLRVECEDARDDMVGARLVGRVEVAGFGSRFERAHDHAGGVRTQVECLAMQERGL